MSAALNLSFVYGLIMIIDELLELGM